MSKQLTIAMFGATGRAGSAILNHLLSDGHRVRALARTPSKLEEHPMLDVLPGDASQAADVARVLRGAEIVVSALGPNKAHPELCNIATGHILAAMEAEGIDRYLAVSGAAVRLPADERRALGKFLAASMDLFGGSLIRDKNREVQRLLESNANWTLVRCPYIASGDAGSLRVDAATPPGFRVHAKAIGSFVAREVLAGRFLRQGPCLAS